MQEVRLGIIGIGNMGTNHLKSILEGKVPGLKVTAIADRKESRREEAKPVATQSSVSASEATETHRDESV